MTWHVLTRQYDLLEYFNHNVLEPESIRPKKHQNFSELILGKPVIVKNHPFLGMITEIMNALYVKQRFWDVVASKCK